MIAGETGRGISYEAYAPIVKETLPAVVNISSSKVVRTLTPSCFGKWMNEPGLYAVPELRGRTSETRFRIPDISVHLGPAQKPPIDRPPFIAIEITSPDDKMNSLMGKFEEYRAWGVAHIWMVNPISRTLHAYTSDGLIKQSALRIPEFSLSIAPEEVFPPECVSQ